MIDIRLEISKREMTCKELILLNKYANKVEVCNMYFDDVTDRMIYESEFEGIEEAAEVFRLRFKCSSQKRLRRIALRLMHNSKRRTWHC